MANTAVGERGCAQVGTWILRKVGGRAFACVMYLSLMCRPDTAGGESVDTVKNRPGWAGISAVESGRIYVVDPDTMSRPGPRLVDALDSLAQMLYPERFE